MPTTDDERDLPKASENGAGGSVPGAERAAEDKPIDEDTLDGLKREARRYGRTGVAIFLIGIVLGAGLIYVSYYLTGISVHDLDTAHHANQMLLLLLVRGTLFGALSVGYLYGVFTIATAYIDQSTRFRKRLYSAHMMNYVFTTFADQIRDRTVKMRHVVNVFVAWNENVDSAFSSVRFQRQGKDLSVGAKTVRLDLKEPKKRRKRK